MTNYTQVAYQQCITCGRVEPASGQCSSCHDVVSLHYFEATEAEADEMQVVFEPYVPDGQERE